MRTVSASDVRAVAPSTLSPLFALVALAALATSATSALSAQAPSPTAPQPGVRFEQAAVDGGHELLVAQCGFCHGTNARGGASGPDLTRSPLVQDDENGKQVGEFLKVGRPDKGMPGFDFTESQVSDLATYLHSVIYLAANRRFYEILDIVTGDAKAGQAFFNGAGRCNACHSASGDLNGVGSKYDPTTLQGRLLLPRTGRSAGPGADTAYRDRNAVRATVRLPSGQSFSGAVVRLTDFDVTLYESASQQMRSWSRDGTIEVDVIDPLQAHLDMLTKWTDTDMHNMTAYLTSLK